MDSKIVLNNYIKADIACDIISQSIAATRKRLIKENSKEAQELLDKLLIYNKEVQMGNSEIIEKVLKGEI